MMVDMDTLQSRPVRRRSENCLISETGGEIVMIDPEQGQYFGLDPIGTDIWHRLERPVLVADLVAELARDYHAPVEGVERDVLALLSHMAEHGLVTTC